MKGNLIIIGAGGHGKVAADIAIRMGIWSEIFFLDDDPSISSVLDFKVIGPTEMLSDFCDEDFFVAIGDNQRREHFCNVINSIGLNLVNLLHPNITIGLDVEIGKGTIVMAGAIINSSSRIGNCCIINTNCSIDHDVRIDDYAHISPSTTLGGSVEIGKSCWIGIGSIVINNIIICPNSIIGAGAVVVNDIAETGTYLGVPAKRRLIP
jgi:sugar O-acyltransferase (sialic acid O-acetyltransferase NeuD family)